MNDDLTPFDHYPHNTFPSIMAISTALLASRSFECTEDHDLLLREPSRWMKNQCQPVEPTDALRQNSQLPMKNSDDLFLSPFEFGAARPQR